MEYEIQIGESFNLESKKTTPKQTIIVTEDQLRVIEMFASTSKDEDLNTIYTINACVFKVLPHFNIK